MTTQKINSTLLKVTLLGSCVGSRHRPDPAKLLLGNFNYLYGRKNYCKFL